MAGKPLRGWVLLALMVAATLWYAWPQALYSLVPLYDLLRYFFPQWTQPLGPWIDSLRGAAGG